MVRPTNQNIDSIKLAPANSVWSGSHTRLPASLAAISGQLLTRDEARRIAANIAKLADFCGSRNQISGSSARRALGFRKGLVKLSLPEMLVYIGLFSFGRPDYVNACKNQYRREHRGLLTRV